MLRILLGLVRRPVVVVAVVAGLFTSGCAIGFRAPATDITATSVTLNGYVGSNRSEPGEWFFKYGKTTDYGSETPKRPVQFVELTGHEVSEPLSGLEPSTNYHYVLCADDQEPGVDAFCSAPQTFRTFADATADSVVVTGNAAGLTNIDIDVTSGPSGENPTGHLSADSQYGHLQASSITCFSISGDTANIGGTLEPNPSGSPGFRVTVVDRGPANTNADSFFGGLSAVTPTDCTTLAGGTLIGNAVVRDAPAP